jgi:hypothetical protein
MDENQIADILQEQTQNTFGSEDSIPPVDSSEPNPSELKTETPQERNFKEVRQARARAERERDEAYARLREMEDAQQNKNVPVDDDVDLNPDDLPEWRHVKKEISKMQRKLDAYEQRSTTSTAENRIRSAFPDFDDVVNAETIRSLREMEPELAQSIADSKDLYNQAAAAYKAIKRFGISQEDNFVSDRERVAKNNAKPRPTQTIAPQHGESPLSHANAFSNGLTPELKKQLYKEMMEARRN